MRGLGVSLMACAAAAALLSACRPRLELKRETVVAGSSALPPRPTASDPPPPDSEDPPRPPPPGRAGRALVKKDRLRSKKSAPPRADLETEPEEEPDLTWHVRASTAAAALGAGDRPDDSAQRGRPLARRPEEGAVASPGPPLRYFSPAPLKKPPTGRRPPRADGEAPDEEDDAGAAALAARRPARAPATGLALDDSIPDSGIGDPNEVGSYHVQIASSPEFSRVLFDKVYPFMGETELDKDLAGAPPSLDHVWIRWSLVDLLDFEHPFSRPHRIVLEPRRGD